LLYQCAADQLGDHAGLDTELLNWQSSAPASVAVDLRTGTDTQKTTVKALSGSHYHVQAGNAEVDLEFIAGNAPDVQFIMNGIAARANYALTSDGIWISHNGLTLLYADTTLAAAEKDAAGSDGRLVAPIDGKVLGVMVTSGETISKGQTLAVLEAMKMEFLISSAVDGVVESVPCLVGQQVKARQLLIALKPAQA
jgi:geranyl-CoA carboxylase alpha subunit